MTTTRHHSPGRVALRFVGGRDLVGGRRTDATFFRDDVTSVTESSWACLAGWKRTAIRLGTSVAGPPAAVGTALSIAHDPQMWGNSTGALATIATAKGAHAAGQAVRERRFRAEYTRPLTRVIRRVTPNAQVHIDRDLGGLAARLLRPMSPAEKSAREWYTEHAQPIVRWLPDQGMKAVWATREVAEPFRNRLEPFRTPREQAPTRIEIRCPAGFVTEDQKKIIRQAVVAKTGLSDLVESWDQIGRVAVGTWTVRERPPSSVTFAMIAPYLDQLAEHEFIVGLTTGGRPVIISLDDDAPHIACSAGSGGGKSVLAKLIGMQVLAKGGRVVILDRKGSHRWARGLEGVTYYTKPADMHDGLIELSELADARNEAALEHDEGWIPGQRVFTIFEEMNATVAQLKNYWESIGGKKTSPAIQAFRNIMFMGRSAWINLFGVAQMLTANTTGGPESRENFGVRALARYTANNWKMLVPECPMPKKSRTRGRWQFVIAGEATETQVAFVSDRELWDYLARVPVSPNSRTTAGLGERTGTTADVDNLLTLEDARRKYCPGISADTLKKRRTRARRTGGGPKPVGQRGKAETYAPEDIAAWLAAESLTETTNAE